jgi:hypothetical protein
MAAKKNPAKPAASVERSATREADENEGASATPKRGRVAREVPVTEVPMCWVTDDDTPDPYLVNVADVDPAKHTRV